VKRQGSKHKSPLVTPAIPWNYLALVVLLLVTFFCFKPGLKGDFTNWDDDRYVKNNELIQKGGFSEIVSEYYMGNYHPLTLLTYHWEYKLAGADPYIYHLTNLLLHLINIVLMFYLTLMLGGNKTFAAFISAALFALHPLHVESVSWVSERKDVLYAMFFFLAWITWVRFRKTGKMQWAGITFLLFVLSCLSKGMAVTFTGVVLFTDLWLKKGWQMKDLKWYLPFTIISVFFGIVAIYAQKAAGFIYLETQWTYLDKLILAAYAWWFYLWKMINPFHLSAFYPFPEKVSGTLPGIYFLAPIFFLGIAGFLLKFKHKYPGLLFALGVYSVCIVIVLQILSVGEALAADRYFYVASAGFFIIAGIAWTEWFEKSGERFKWVFYLLPLGILSVLGWLTIQRTQVWKDSLTLWEDTLAKYERISLAHYNLGVTYGLEMKDYIKAEPHFLRAVEIRPGYPQAMYNLAIIYANRGEYDRSTETFKQLLSVNPEYPLAWSGIGYNLEKNGKYTEATEAYLRETKRSPEAYNVWLGLGVNQGKSGDLSAAMISLKKASELDFSRPEPWVNMGVFHFNAGKYSEALGYYEEALKKNPSNPEAYFNQGSAFLNMGKLDEAEAAFRKALEYNPRLSEVYINLGNIASMRKNTPAQVSAYQEAARLGHAGAQSWLSGRNIDW
jgi:tetratricopeptide (TPR) repeat protein